MQRRYEINLNNTGGSDNGITTKEQNMLLAPRALASNRYRSRGLEPVYW